MKIYKIFHKVDGYKAIDTRDSKLEKDFINLGNDVDFSKHVGESFNWSGEKSDKISHYPFIDGSTPVFDEEAYHVIEPIIAQHVSTYEILVDGIRFKILDPIVVFGLLNAEHSVIKYFKDGRIMNIKKYAFNRNAEIPPIFKIQELKTFTFVVEDVINALNREGIIEGLDFEECKIV